MKTSLLRTALALAAALSTVQASAQTNLVRVGSLIGTGATLVAGDVTFSNFKASRSPFAGIIPDGLAALAASTAVNADGTVSLTFTVIDPATGLPALQRTMLMLSVSYDVTVTNPARVLGAVNQAMGPQTGNAFDILNHIEPPPGQLQMGSPGIGCNCSSQTLFVDEQFSPGFGIRTGILLVPASPLQDITGPGSSKLPGGLRTRMSLNSFFGITTDNHGIFHPEAGPFDGATLTFGLVPASTPQALPPPALADVNFSQPGIGTLTLVSGWAPIGGVPVTMTTSNAAALPLPATLTLPEGAHTGIFPVGDAQIDAPTVVNVTATQGGATLQQTVTVQPSVPLGLLPINLLPGPFPSLPYTFGVYFNRINYSTQVVTLTSSHPALFPVPPTITVPPLAQGVGNIVVNQQAAPAVTPVTVTATANGSSVSRTITLPKYVDFVSISRAELVVKNGALKVDASSNLAIAVLTLSNATTGAPIGTMTNLGKGKYSFLGTVAPVTTLRLDSNYSGSATFGVAQK